jgi:hypothetical protein
VDGESENPMQDDSRERIEILGAVISSALFPVTGLIELLIYKGVITTEEVSSYFEHLLEAAPDFGENDVVVKAMWLTMFKKFKQP